MIGIPDDETKHTSLLSRSLTDRYRSMSDCGCPDFSDDNEQSASDSDEGLSAPSFVSGPEIDRRGFLRKASGITLGTAAKAAGIGGVASAGAVTSGCDFQSSNAQDQDKPTPDVLTVENLQCLMGEQRQQVIGQAVDLPQFDEVASQFTGGQFLLNRSDAIAFQITNKGGSYPIASFPLRPTESAPRSGIPNPAVVEAAFLPSDPPLFEGAIAEPVVLGHNAVVPPNATPESEVTFQFAEAMGQEFESDQLSWRISSGMPRPLVAPLEDFFSAPQGSPDVSCAACCALCGLISAYGCAIAAVSADGSWSGADFGAAGCGAAVALICGMSGAFTCEEACIRIGACPDEEKPCDST
jgi:hypothetical protein